MGDEVNLVAVREMVNRMIADGLMAPLPVSGYFKIPFLL